MRFRLTLLNGALLDISFNSDDEIEADERLTFGFASVLGSADVNDEAKMLDTSDRTSRR